MQPRTIFAFALAALALVLPLAYGRVHTHIQTGVIDSSNVDSAFGNLDAASQFHAFKHKHGKKYASPAHEEHRFGIFQENLKRAAELAKKNPQAQFGVNQYSDLHPLEFKRTHLNFNPAVGDAALLRQNREVRRSSRHASAIPASFDWRKPDKNRPVGITAVKDQGQCGSCWAFSATEGVESAFILAGNKAVALAPQQTVDCDQTDAGCNGGDLPTAFAYMETAGLQPEETYPYTSGLSGSAGTCAYNQSAVVAKVKSFVYATPSCSDACTNQDEAKLAESLYNNGPVSICVDASTWQSYAGGVLTSASGCGSAYNILDHCVQLVGYGVDAASGLKFWTVRNSWATSWGEAGFIRLEYGKNTCGVADEATQVIIA